ncbi:nuclease-related domain-containing protein [Sediminibacillus massiliensis]|uniref:nuclease-related domain-containing protein n=1 Tax=Sediminibacillus massiliensis TaxID=1926277 RepID=UPI000988462E|nr:nuclease-related domain-containing protein [Sediminibacillus massiliensis]
MNKPNTELPLNIRRLEALHRRTPKSHSKRAQMQADLARRYAGFRGEQNVKYHLRRLDNKHYYILHDIRLRYQTMYFQIDTLILSKEFILIAEVKNISGTLFFDTVFNQMIRKTEDKEEGFRSPLAQVQYQQELLYRLFQQNNLPSLPIESLIVISLPSTIIKTDTADKEITSKIVHAEDLIDRIGYLCEQYLQASSKIPPSLKEIGETIKHANIPKQTDILAQYDVTKEALLSGDPVRSVILFL